MLLFDAPFASIVDKKKDYNGSEHKNEYDTSLGSRSAVQPRILFYIILQ